MPDWPIFIERRNFADFFTFSLDDRQRKTETDFVDSIFRLFLILLDFWFHFRQRRIKRNPQLCNEDETLTVRIFIISYTHAFRVPEEQERG